jgi:hypothetical protein
MKTPDHTVKLRQLVSGSAHALLLAASILAIWGASHFFLRAEAPASLPESYAWSTVVNNLNAIPGAEAKVFNSYNQPSVSEKGLVIFRARSKGPDAMSGIYRRDMKSGGILERVADRNTTVPAPNNTLYPPDNTLSEFIEFPSIPRLSAITGTIATRGNSQPVWTYQVDGADTKAGTTGLYMLLGSNLTTGVSQLGAVPPPAAPVYGVNYFPYMQVPGALVGTKFDVFPGSPAVASDDVVVFKGNYTETNIGKTGIFYRDPVGGAGQSPVQLIANTSTLIPNVPESAAGVRFGSTAPPSVAGNKVVFAGFDNEETPTYGGIYLAPLAPAPVLQTLVGIGDPVPGENGATFNRFGEGLSFDGRYVSFWGAWGSETKTLWLDCPADGNADLLAYCRDFVGDNFPVQVSVNQGIFVVDITTGAVTKIARTGEDIADFLFWTFSGRPPGVGESDDTDGELPRWRSSAFSAVSQGAGGTPLVAFKARSGALDPVENNYLDPLDGIYLGNGNQVDALLDTSMPGPSLDPAAPAGSFISALGLERESFRGEWLTVTATMLDPITTESMAGIYITGAGEPAQLPVITSELKYNGQVGRPLSYQITADNTPTSFGAEGLPAGVSVNTSTGLISGTPTKSGNFRVTISATNAAGTAAATLKLKIAKGSQKITFTTPGTQKFQKGRQVPLVATATSGLPVLLTSSNPRVISIRGNTATIQAKGRVNVAAFQPGNADYQAAPRITRPITIR